MWQASLKSLPARRWMRAFEIPPASHRKTWSTPEQVGVEGLSEDCAPATVGSGEAGSEEDAPEADEFEDEVEETNSEKSNLGAGTWSETVPGVPCSADKSPARGRAIKRINNPLTQQRFTRPPASRAAFEHKLP